MSAREVSPSPLGAPTITTNPSTGQSVGSWSVVIRAPGEYRFCLCLGQASFCDAGDEFMGDVGTFLISGPTGLSFSSRQAGLPMLIFLEGHYVVGSELGFFRSVACTDPVPRNGSLRIEWKRVGPVLPLLGGVVRVCWRFNAQAPWVVLENITLVGPERIEGTWAGAGNLQVVAGDAFTLHLIGFGLSPLDMIEFVEPGGDSGAVGRAMQVG